jgi:guanylate kinase
MGLPPKLSAEQRQAALAKAALSRKRRSEIKAQVKNSVMTIDDVLELAVTDEAIGKMRVKELLESLSGVGKIRVVSLMERLNISPTRRIQGLGRHQVKELRQEFMKPDMTIKPGRLVVLSGPGGVGKSTVAKKLREADDFWVSVSATTRKPRVNELHGKDYFFVSDEEFASMISNDDFLEWAEFAGNRYGTPQKQVEEALAQGRNVLLEIEIAGAKPQSLLVFLEPPSWEELVARLEGRGTDGAERRAERLALAQEELAAAAFFDVVLVNDQVESVVQRLVELAQN